MGTAMEQISDEAEVMTENFTLTLEFAERPLGFRVEEAKEMSNDGKEEETLQVAKIQDTHEHLREKGLTEGLTLVRCNDMDFRNKSYQEKLEALKNDKLPLQLTFQGKGFLRRQSTIARLTTGISPMGTMRDMTMGNLYPDLQAQMQKGDKEAREYLMQHPLVKKNPDIKVWLERDDFKDLV